MVCRRSSGIFKIAPCVHFPIGPDGDRPADIVEAFSKGDEGTAIPDSNIICVVASCLCKSAADIDIPFRINCDGLATAGEA